MNDQKSIEFIELIAAPTKQVYAAFSSSVALESWFSDFAEVDFNDKGRVYFWWNVGYYASGLFTKILDDQQLAFTWSGPDEPHSTQVEIFFTPKGDVPQAYAPEVDVSMVETTEVKIRHSGIGAGSEWAERIKAYQRGWEVGLSNLKSVMETGIDKRVYDRPILGIIPGELIDDAKALDLGLPLPYGFVLGGTVAGMGAEAAGLRSGDVVVSLNQHDLKRYQDFAPALRGCKAGDEVEVIFYRDKKQHIVQMKLSRQQIPKLPQSAVELSESIAKIYADIADERDALFDAVSDEEASARPASDAWSAKETLAHLLYTERWLHLAISMAISSQRTGGFANQLEMIAAMASAYTLDELLTELRNSEQVTVASLKALPGDFVADKRKFFSLVNGYGQGYASHSRGHFDQIKAAIEAAKAE
jgi:uncharacterized protein YndB with AHSA1/START domain